MGYLDSYADRLNNDSLAESVKKTADSAYQFIENCLLFVHLYNSRQLFCRLAIALVNQILNATQTAMSNNNKRLALR